MSSITILPDHASSSSIVEAPKQNSSHGQHGTAKREAPKQNSSDGQHVTAKREAPKQNSSDGQHGTAKRTTVLRIIGRSFLGLMVLVGLALVICWLIVFPKKPDFSLERVDVTPHSLTDRKLNASIAFHIRSFNPNKKAAIHIDHMKMTVNEMGDMFQTSIPTFSQPPENLILLTPTILVNVIFPYGRFDKRLRLDGISPKLHLSAEIRYTLKRWTSKRRWMEVYCDDFILKVSGSTYFDNNKCKVDL